MAGALDEAIDAYLHAAPRGVGEAIAAARALLAAVEGADPGALRAGLDALIAPIDAPALGVAGLSAMLAGALVEAGAPPEVALPAVLARLGGALERPDPLDADRGLERLCLGAIAMLTRDDGARRRVAADEALQHKIAQAAKDHGQVEFLRKVALVIDEELLVLHPVLCRGFRVHVSGVADNFQLHTLLAGELVGGGHLPGTSPSRGALDVARGLGPQHIDEHVEGVWDLYDHTVLRAPGDLPGGTLLRAMAESARDAWILGEGIPRDIPAFEGQRVLVLGAPSYVRTWRAARLFEALRAEARLVDVLPRDDVTRWHDRLRQAA